MGSSKEKICKCGHNKDLHPGKKSIISLSTQCSKCPCSSYMNRDLPKKSDYIYVYLSVGLGIFFIVLSAFIISDVDPAKTETQNEIISFTLGEIYHFITLIFLIISIYLFFNLILSPILDLLSAKKRNTFPSGDQ